VEEAVKYRLDIVGVSSTKVPGSGTRDLDHGWKLFYSGVDPTVHAQAGVGILTSPRLAARVVEWTPRSGRVAVLRLRLEDSTLALIQVYAPNLESEYAAFLEEVSLALETLPTTDSIMLLGDFNAHVGVDEQTWKGVIGRNGDSSLNANGSLLLDFCASSGLSIMNTYFHHRHIHKYTWERVTCRQRSLIDFAVVSADLKSLVMDVRVRRGAELSTDHHLVVCRLRIPRKAMLAPKKPIKAFRIKWEELKKESVVNIFADNMVAKFSQIPSEQLDVETEWSLFKTGLLSAATKACGWKRVGSALVGGRRTPWWTEDVRTAVNEKKKAYKAWLGNPSQASRQIYEEKRKLAKIVVASAKARSWENFGVVLESNFRDAPKIFWQTIRRLRKDKNSSLKALKNKRGDILIKEEDILHRWREYFGELLNPVGPSNSNFPEVQLGAENSPTDAEVRGAVRSLKSGKAAGVDEIRPEMLKALGPQGISWLTRVFRVAWESGRVPLDWQTGVVVPLFKKGDQRECCNYRGITLLSIPGKLFAKVLNSRLSEIVEHKIQDEQCGFRRGRGVTDQLFTLQQVIEKAWEYDIPLYNAFVDLEKAYDRVDRGRLWSILEEYGVDLPLIRAIASLYSKSRSCVRVLGRKSEYFSVGAGLRQGCVLSPLLFVIYMDRIARRSLGQECVMIGKTKLSHLLLADDLDLLASSQSDLQRALERFAGECDSASMRINTTKTEALVVSRTPVQCALHVSGASLKQVEKYKYLGVSFTSNGKWNTEIDRRIGAASAVMRQLYRGVISKAELSREAKISVFKSIYVPTLTYGHELWVMTERMRSRVQAAEMRFLRRVAGVRLLDRVRSSAIRESLGIEPLLLRIERSQLRWLGHVLRMPPERLVKQVLLSNPIGTRPRGRPRRRWKDHVSQICSERLSLTNWSDIMSAAEDRDLWRELLRGLTPRP
jgi:exonuclease III